MTWAPPPAPRARHTPGVSGTQRSGCRSSLPPSEGPPVGGAPRSDPDSVAGRLVGHRFFGPPSTAVPLRPPTSALGLWLLFPRLHLFSSNGLSHRGRWPQVPAPVIPTHWRRGQSAGAVWPGPFPAPAGTGGPRSFSASLSPFRHRHDHDRRSDSDPSRCGRWSCREWSHSFI